MKKLFFAIFVLSSLCLTTPAITLAANVLDPACSDTPNASVCQGNRSQDIKNNSIYGSNGILAKVATVIAIIVGVACVIAIIIGGLRYVLSGGDSQQTANAKNAILYAIIGLVITIAARSLLVFVLGRIK